MADAQNITMKVFLWFLFIVIALFLAYWLFGIYNDYIKSGSIDKGTSDLMSCNDYVFDVKDVHYENETLSFVIRNTMGKQIRNITVQSDYSSVTRNLQHLTTGSEQEITIEDFRVEQSFAVFPENCAKYNIKVIKLGI